MTSRNEQVNAVLYILLGVVAVFVGLAVFAAGAWLGAGLMALPFVALARLWRYMRRDAIRREVELHTQRHLDRLDNSPADKPPPP